MRILVIPSLVAVLGLAWIGTATAGTYVGVKKCKVCHKKDELGNQFGKWESTKHSKAFLNLGTPEAKEAGKKMGVTDPQTDGKCLICHTTAYEAAADQKEGVKPEDGVSCEECHGAGSEYKPEEVHTKDKAAAEKLGFKTLKKKEDRIATCQRCHSPERNGNKNPMFKEFDSEKFWGEIAHPLPKK